MNARAILQAQGWRGDGHTLHATSDGIGLKKRLLVSRKDGTGGLGASQYANDQWWLSALDEQLKGLDTSNGKVVQTVKGGKLDRLDHEAGKPELYKFFIYGGILQGTVDLLPTNAPEPNINQPAQLSKLRPSTMIANPSESESTTSSSAVTTKKETKEERRARKEARRQRREQKRIRKEARKLARSGTSSETSTTENSIKSVRVDTKEERKARKEAKRKRREEKKRLKG
ncbi:hypothetical protein jhhlp_001010 [Lomentospora prolificans]|uniref:G-patch domain-containing protein n=1 Tax=Lomentospora prolificans TaxID=41688 RepID=A0A2N3NK27_9PEZI|nr:hypothetical protein jhhlp_001010 [Lomentospora prolificans]